MRRSDERAAILGVLFDAEGPGSPADVAFALGVRSNNIKQLLYKMAKADEVIKLRGRAGYVHPDRTDLTPNKADKLR